MTFTPLASTADFQGSPFAEMVAGIAQAEMDRTMAAATRAAEGLTGCRLAPFTITETTRLQDGDVEDLVPTGLPLPAQAQFGLSKASAMNIPSLVRHAWVRNYPRSQEDAWTGALTSVTVSWALQADPFLVPATQVQFEADTGHVRFVVGTFTPPGTTAIVTYTGGYTTVPDDLKQACLYLAAEQLAIELDPTAMQASRDPDVLHEKACRLLVPYGAACK